MERTRTNVLTSDDHHVEAALQPMLPAFGAGCITEIVPTLLRRDRSTDLVSSFVPGGVLGARQIVLLVLDGLGWLQFLANHDTMATLSQLDGGPITSVLPTTTATALTSISTGRAPCEHGVIGYRVAAGGSVLNVLKWTTPAGDARELIKPRDLQLVDPFLGTSPPVISRAEFEGTGFTDAHLANATLVGWRMPSTIGVEVSRLLGDGVPFIYAYYDGIDKIAHDKGLGEYFRAELAATDRLIADIVDRLPKGSALCVTADHGQIEVLEPPIVLDDEITESVTMLSGEGRFRWLHVREGSIGDVRAACERRYGDVAWVRTRSEMVAEGWFGGGLAPGVAARLGDVALVAKTPVAFFDPNDTGELRLVARHGSATREEMLVPFLSYVA